MLTQCEFVVCFGCGWIGLDLQQIEVPETLLKKRKQNEKAREERLAAAVAARKVCSIYAND